MKNLFYLFFSLLFISFGSCDKDEQLTCCDFNVNYTVEYDLYNDWLLVGIIQNEPFEEECANGQVGNIRFYENGTFGGNLACNSMGGNYAFTESDELEIIDVYQTLRGCLQDESEYWEDQFSSELRDVIKYEIVGNKLTLFTDNKNRLVFIAED